MKEEKFFMSDKEIRKALVIQKLIDGVLTTNEAAEILSLSARHVKRLKAGVIQNNLGSLAHGNRARKPYHAIPDELKEKVLLLIQQAPYSKANNTHLSELLAEHEHIYLSVSSIRRIRKCAGIASPRKHRSPQLHRRRNRKVSEGMLIQIDASPHHWLGRDQPAIALVGGIDDATGNVVGALFRPTEDLQGYFEMTRQIITNYGIPLAIYSDRHAIFRSSNEDKFTIEDELEGKQFPLSQFGRAMSELGIEHIKARSPQAKGRIERLWGTLQDRLTVEMALANVTTLEEANQFLQTFISKHNAQFGVNPTSTESAFRPALPLKELHEILCIKEKRRLKAGVISYGGKSYQLYLKNVPANCPDHPITVHVHFDGHLKASDTPKSTTLYDLIAVPKPERAAVTNKAKEKAGPRLPRRPAENHPWRQWDRRTPQGHYTTSPPSSTIPVKV